MHPAEAADSGNREPVAPVGSGPAVEFSGMIPACRIDIHDASQELTK
jgi:hypothetical protein